MGAFKPGSDDSQASMAIDPQTIQLESVLSVGLVASLFQPSRSFPDRPAWLVVVRLVYRCVNTTQTASTIETQMGNLIQNV